MNYFLLAVSNRNNLEACMRYGLAGFTSSASGLWTYVDIAKGDYVSFLYGARVFNLYEVVEKFAIRRAETAPPWPPLVLQPSGRTYHFPFRLLLRPVRTLDEPLVRMEFAYVAENLLLRGGYRKTHFQADQTTLQAVSQMGSVAVRDVEPLNLNRHPTFVPRLVGGRQAASPPEVFPFQELFLQALLRKRLGWASEMQRLLTKLGIADLAPGELEILSEKAFPEGHVDLLVKESAPTGTSRKVIIEVKNTVANEGDVRQLVQYRDILGPECAGAVLACRGLTRAGRSLAQSEKVTMVFFRLEMPPEPVAFDELVGLLALDFG